jgi:hypothetical protein
VEAHTAGMAGTADAAPAPLKRFVEAWSHRLPDVGPLSEEDRQTVVEGAYDAEDAAEVG